MAHCIRHQVDEKADDIFERLRISLRRALRNDTAMADVIDTLIDWLGDG